MQPSKLILNFITLTENAALRKRNSSTFLKRFNGMSVVKQNKFDWHPGRIISGESVGHTLFVLNRKLCLPPELLKNIWQAAQIRCTVDGGTNRWLQFLNTHCEGLQMKPPDLITGDFDSITTEALNYFKTTRKVHTLDQDFTDFTKAITVVEPLLQPKHLNDIIVLHDTSGRFDQIMANINTLYKFKDLRIFLLSSNSLTWLLSPGKHSIHIPKDLVKNERWCALIPIGEPAKNITTTGLKWNLKNSVMEFGGLVSTSNTYASEYVQIETPTSLIWSMGVISFEDD